MSKEIPILFQSEMVQAILEGRKTQTRRVVKPQPTEDKDSGRVFVRGRSPYDIHNFREPFADAYSKWRIGDLLWVRETFVYRDKHDKYYFKADHPDHDPYAHNGWKPSIHMPKAAARLWLEVAGVRVERLQEISQEDAKSEGVYPAPHRCPGWKNELLGFADCYKCAYKLLWNQINGEGGNGWETNPWVWVIEFKVLSTTGKP